MTKKLDRKWTAAILFVLAFGMWIWFPAKDARAASPKKWYQISRTIMHATGGIEGKRYTNSKEALEATLQRRRKLIEMDLMFTSDGVLVGKHDWKSTKNKRQTFEKFKATKTKGGFTPLTAEEVIKTIAACPNAYLVVDCKEKDIARVYRELKRLCIATGNRSFLNRIVVQIYYKSDYTKVRKVYPFKNWSFTLYQIRPKTIKQYKDIASFCKKKKIQAVTFRYNWVTKTRVNLFRKKKIACLAYTVNSMDTYRKLRKMGITAVFTDYL